jgi:S1-C subfamily serine protease
LICLAPVACASSQYPSVDDPMPPPELGAGGKGSGAVSASAKAAPVTSLKRADVERLVDAGFGRFLGHVSVQANVTAGKFGGWVVVGLEPPEFWQGVDLRPGDVVTRVNGMPIERETEAFDAFQAVRQAPALEVSYLRQNQPRTLRLPIIGAPSPALPHAPPPAPAASTAKPTSG